MYPAGLCKAICQGLHDQIRIDEKDFNLITKSVVQRMLRNNKEIIKLVHGNAIDPARMRQSDAEVRDCEFLKLELYIKLLYDMSKIPWKTYSEIPRLNIYNMNEVTINTYAHRRKAIGMARKLVPHFK